EVLHPHDEEAGDIADNCGNGAAEKQAADRLAPSVSRAENACRICAKPAEHGVTQSDDAGIAEHEIDRECKKGGDRYLVGKAEIGREEIERQERGKPEQDLEDGPAITLPDPGDWLGVAGGGVGKVHSPTPIVCRAGRMAAGAG